MLNFCLGMAASQLTTTSLSAMSLRSVDGIKSSPINIASCEQFRRGGLSQRFFRGIAVKAASVVAPKVS